MSAQGDFRFSHRWPDMAKYAGQKAGWFDRTVVDRLEQRDLEIEDRLAGDVTVGVLGQGTTDVNGEAVITIDPPRGRLLVMYAAAPTHTAGTLVIEGFGSGVATADGAFACIVLPGGFTEVTAICRNAAGAALSGKVVSLTGFGV